VLDLGAPNFEPVQQFEKVVAVIIRKLPYLTKWRTLSVIGTSFPKSMAEIKQSVEIIPRREWQLYKLLVPHLQQGGLRIPTFGDYTASYPDHMPMDMRFLKPTATIRYAVDDGWLVVKGKNVRDHKFQQYRQLAQTVVNSPKFCGPRFSQGDQYISECASGKGKTGNLTSWRKVATVHHIEKVITDIASFYGP
jgi:hypothetical protein